MTMVNSDLKGLGEGMIIDACIKAFLCMSVLKLVTFYCCVVLYPLMNMTVTYGDRLYKSEADV